jgi:hypothetical protein
VITRTYHGQNSKAEQERAVDEEYVRRTTAVTERSNGDQ